MTPASVSPRGPSIPWSLLEFHLDEAEFLWTQREHALWGMDVTPREVEAGDEGRLLAHLDALVLGGRRFAERLVLPALASEEPARVAVATWVLLSAQDTDWRTLLLPKLEALPEETLPGAVRALELLGDEALSAWMLQSLPGRPPPVQAGLLRALRLHGVDVGAALAKVDVDSEPALLVEAVRSALTSPGPLTEGWLNRSFTHPLAAVRDAALDTGLLLGSRRAWEHARERVRLKEPLPRAALLAFAVAGEARDVAVLTEGLADPSTRSECLWALGFSGRGSAAEAMLPLLADPDVGVLAAESFAAITGLPVAPPYFLEAPPPEDEDEAPVIEDDLSESLPAPRVPLARVDATAIQQWWTSTPRPGLAPGERSLRGAPLTWSRMALALEGEPMRRRPALAWEVALRGGGTVRVEPRAWLTAQRQQARGVSGLRPALLARSWSQLLTR